MDGGFFEKFGSLLKEQADQAAEDERTTDGGKDGKESEENGGPEMEPLLEENDSEPEETDKEELISEAMGWNVSNYVQNVLWITHGLRDYCGRLFTSTDEYEGT